MKQHEEHLSEFDQDDFQQRQFEQELMQAMRPADAPEGFADRVLAQVAAAERPSAKVLVMPGRTRTWASGAIAAAVLVGVFGGHEVHVRHQRQEAVRAQQQLELAVQITADTLRDVRIQMRQAGVPVGD